MIQLARAATIPDARQAAMTAVGAEAIKLHEAVMRAKPEWFQHIVQRCEAKAVGIAEQASRGADGDGDATFIEVYTRTFPALFAAAIAAYEQALNDNS
jgi:hypothetical protein